MKRFSIPKIAISLPFAIFSAAILISINEASYYESSRATEKIRQAEQTRHSVSHLMQILLNSETGQRGYLLTGDPQYLQPHDLAAAQLGKALHDLRTLLADSLEDLAEFDAMARHIERKQAEVELSVAMRKAGKDDAWMFMVNTDVGMNSMEAIRLRADQLAASALKRMEAAHAKVENSLLLSRIGIAAMGLGALLAFYMYLVQTQALIAAGMREQSTLAQERDRLEKQVRERTGRLAELATHLQNVREDERGHLARELHDELGALLTAAKLDVARIRSRLGHQLPEASERLEHLTATLNSGIALKRRIVEDLRPSSLTHLGLIASLEILAREFQDRSAMQIRTRLDKVDLSDAEQLTIYRLVQESLTNMGKYARASSAEIRLLNQPGEIVIEVDDDGAGFDTAQIGAGSHGLAGMRHRVEAAGGKLMIQSSHGKGTRIRAALPKTKSPNAPMTQPSSAAQNSQPAQQVQQALGAPRHPA